MVERKPSYSAASSVSSSTSRNSSIRPPPSTAPTEDWDADDEGAMSGNDSPPVRPLTVAIPTSTGAQGPYCPRRPNLREILANTAAAPWSLAAFMAYLSNNHCLETLEFTMDAGRYRKHYQKMESRAVNGALPPAKDREYVQALWQKLVDAYIKPNGTREVNLPSDVRDPILSLRPETMPPSPDKLDRAVSKIYELMEESVLVPFLNSVYPQSAAPTLSSYPGDATSSGEDFQLDDGRPFFPRPGRRASPPQPSVRPYSQSFTHTSSGRQSAPHLNASAMGRARHSVKMSPTTSAPAGSMHSSGSGTFTDPNLSASGSGSGPGMTDDSASADSPTHDGPMTPPTSPPMSDASPKRDSGMWRKLGSLGRMKVGKKKSHGALKEEQ